jgi:YVTN family beta-propeller protein
MRLLRLCRLLAVAGAVSCFLASAQTLAQNAYITNSSDNTVSVIATGTNTVTATIPVGGFPFRVAVTPDGSKVYVANILA